MKLGIIDVLVGTATTKKGKASALQLAAANFLFLILIEKDKPQKD